MPIRRKSSINKRYLESLGQGSLFGHDNIYFKTVNSLIYNSELFSLF